MNKGARILWEIVRCPKCLSRLNLQQDMVECTNLACEARYPIVNETPILINEDASIFSFDDFQPNKVTFFKKRGKLLEWIIRHAPSISHNMAAQRNYQALSKLTQDRNPSPRILIIGGGEVGEGLKVLVNNLAIDLVETDVSFGPRVQLICDAHNLPFADESFDAVVVQAVMEHVLDPFACVNEIYRVLGKNAFIYAETPFIQQVHGGCYDFIRFTHRGHRRLFRKFSEIDSGMTGGPGMALAWSWQYFLWSFASTTFARSLLGIVGRLSGFYLKYFDYLCASKQRAYDGASGFYFLGSKVDFVMKDIDLVKKYPEI